MLRMKGNVAAVAWKCDFAKVSLSRICCAHYRNRGPAPASEPWPAHPNQATISVRDKEQSQKPSDSGQESESARDSLIVVRESAGHQHQALVPSLARPHKLFLSFSSAADFSRTMPAFILIISHSDEHGE